MKISVNQVVLAAECRLAAVTAEAAAFVVLEATRAVRDGAISFHRSAVQLDDQGRVSVLQPDPQSVEAPLELESELRSLLAELLRLARTVPPALAAIAGQPSGAGLDALEAALLSALIPLNPAAARRGLARLYRETSRLESSTVQNRPVAPQATPPEPGGDEPKLLGDVAARLQSEASLPTPTSPEAGCAKAAPVDVSANGDPPSARTAAQEGDAAASAEALEIEVDFDPRRSSLPAPADPLDELESCLVESSLETSSPEASILDSTTPVFRDCLRVASAAAGVEPDAQLDAPERKEISAPIVSAMLPVGLRSAAEHGSVDGGGEPEESTDLSPTPASAVRVSLPMPDPAMRESEPPADPVQLELFAADLLADDVDQLLSMPPDSPGGSEPLRSRDGSLEAGATEAPDTTPCTAPSVSEVADFEERRSNLEELMNEFLAHTRSEQVLSASLRKMVGIEVPAAKTGS